jgi:hypothetical protein
MDSWIVAALALVVGAAVIVAVVRMFIGDARRHGSSRVWLATASQREVNRYFLKMLVVAVLFLVIAGIGFTRLQARLAALAAHGPSVGAGPPP